MNVQKIWPEILALIQEQWGSQVINTWFKSVIVLRYEPASSLLYIVAPNQFVLDWIKTHYQESLVHACNRVLARHDCRIHMSLASVPEVEPIIPARPLAGVYLTDGPEEQVVALSPERSPVEVTEAARAEKKSVPFPAAGLGNRVLAPQHKRDVQGVAEVEKLVSCVVAAKPVFQQMYAHYTFDRFVEGPHNSLAYHAARAVAEHPGTRYNPYYVYGPSGLGKTHLLHAIAHEATARFGRIKILYQPTDKFVQDFINAIRLQRMHQFTARYQDVDMLLMDDIHCISHKEQTQEAFFKIFNVLHQAGKQIICTSDVAPSAIEGFAERMRSRLQWGLVADICVPTLETKIAIIKKKSENAGYDLPDDVIEYVAGLMTGNIRQLEGALMRLRAYSSLMQVNIDMAAAQKVLEPVRPLHDGQDNEAGQPNDAPVASFSLVDILHLVCERYGVTPEQARSQSRDKQLVRVRHIAMYSMKRYTRASLREISICLGRKDHSTVLHAYERIEKMRTTQPDIQICINYLESRLAGK